MRSNTLTVTVERSTENLTARRNQSLLTALKAHYNDLERDKEFSTFSWRCSVAVFWSTSIGALYTTMFYTAPYVIGQVLGLNDWFVYWAKVVIGFGFVQTSSNWLCFTFYQSFHKVTDDRPYLTKTLWDEHPLEMGKKLDDADPHNLDPRLLQWKHCVKCQMPQPPRAHHCKICHKCVLKRDHHCFLLGSCIGYYNQRNFIVLSLYLFLSCIIILPLNYIYLRDFQVGSTWDYFLPWTVYNWAWLGGCDLLTLLLISHYYILPLLAPLTLSFFLLSVISVYLGRTMYEFVKDLPIRVMTSRAENFRSVFGDFWIANLLFPAVILFKQPGDGTEWPKVFRVFTRKKQQDPSTKLQHPSNKVQ